MTELRSETMSLEDVFLELAQPEEPEEEDEDIAVEIPLDANGRVVLRVRGGQSAVETDAGDELPPEDEEEADDRDDEDSCDEDEDDGEET